MRAELFGVGEWEILSGELFLRRNKQVPLLFDVLSHLPRQRPFRKPQLIGLLQIHPEFSGSVEKCGQTHRRISCDTAVALDDGCDAISRHFEGLGEHIGVNRRI